MIFYCNEKMLMTTMWFATISKQIGTCFVKKVNFFNVFEQLCYVAIEIALPDYFFMKSYDD